MLQSLESIGKFHARGDLLSEIRKMHTFRTPPNQSLGLINRIMSGFPHEYSLWNGLSAVIPTDELIAVVQRHNTKIIQVLMSFWAEKAPQGPCNLKNICHKDPVI
jgi:hypothetical protein